MISELLLFLEQSVLPLGPLGVFAASLIEEIIAPIPSAAVMLSAGFLFVEGPWSPGGFLDVFYFVALPAAAGVSIGSLFVYSIARYIGTELLVRWGKIFGVTEEGLLHAQSYFKGQRKDEIAVFVGRVIPVVPAVVIALGAGLIKMPVVRYVLISFAGTLIRAMVLGTVGWRAGELYITYAETIDRFESYILSLIAAVVVGAGLFLFFKQRRRHAINK